MFLSKRNNSTINYCVNLSMTICHVPFLSHPMAGTFRSLGLQRFSRKDSQFLLSPDINFVGYPCCWLVSERSPLGWMGPVCISAPWMCPGCISAPLMWWRQIQSVHLRSADFPLSFVMMMLDCLIASRLDQSQTAELERWDPILIYTMLKVVTHVLTVSIIV